MMKRVKLNSRGKMMSMRMRRDHKLLEGSMLGMLVMCPTT